MEQINAVSTQTPSPATSVTELTAFSELFMRTLKMYEVLFKKVVILALISVVAILPMMLTIFAFGYFGTQALAVKIMLGVVFVLTLLLFIYAATAAQAATLYLLEDSSRTVGDYFRQGMGVAWQVIVVSLLTGILTLLWTLLLIVPGIIFSVYYSFSIYALVYENQTGMSALKRSHALVKNYWWAVVSRTVILALIYLAALGVLSLPIYFLPEDSVLAIFWNMVLSALRFITGPIFVIFAYLIFKELVNIKGSAIKDLPPNAISS